MVEVWFFHTHGKNSEKIYYIKIIELIIYWYIDKGKKSNEKKEKRFIALTKEDQVYLYIDI